MTSSSDLRQTLNEGLRGVLGEGQPVGRPAPKDIGGGLTETYEGLYDAPIMHGHDSGGWRDHHTAPTYVQKARGEGNQLAIPSPWTWSAAGSPDHRRSMGHAPNQIDAGERSWRAGLEQTRRNNAPKANGPPITGGPQFDQLSLPGMGQTEQMALFRTRSLEHDGDAPVTSVGMYNDSPDAADWVASKAHASLDLNAFGPPGNSFEYGESTAGYGVDGVARGGRDHINAIAHAVRHGEVDEAHDALFAGAQFGDKRLRDNPVHYDELEHHDDGSNYALFTPEGTQAVGFDYEDHYADNRVMITGAGTGERFRGNRFGMRGAVDFARQKNAEGYLVHGNSFTPDGQAAFGNRGALTESEVDDLLDDAEENAREQADKALEADAAYHWSDYGREQFMADNPGVEDPTGIGAREQFIQEYRDNEWGYVEDSARVRREEALGELVGHQRDLLRSVQDLFGGAVKRSQFIKGAVQERLADKSGKKVGD